MHSTKAFGKSSRTMHSTETFGEVSKFWFGHSVSKIAFRHCIRFSFGKRLTSFGIGFGTTLTSFDITMGKIFRFRFEHSIFGGGSRHSVNTSTHLVLSL